MSVRAFLVPASLLGLLAVTIQGRADWVELKDGQTLRGLDFKEKGKLRLFTLESGREILLDPAAVAGVKKSPPGETVEFRGRNVTLREKIRLNKEEERRRESQALRNIESWARKGKGWEEARKAFETLPGSDRQRYLVTALTKSKSVAARSLAVGELDNVKSPGVLTAFAHAAVNDGGKDVRAKCMASLKASGDPGLGERFVPYLSSSSAGVRIRAAEALAEFPTRRAVPSLIARLERTWTEFGRSSFFQGTVRSYIKDYNLVSGGTGFSVIEVADPEIETVSTGVVLDAKVTKVEIVRYVAALKKATGQDFGADPKKWQEWWAANRGPN